jgi:hypothetical protein
MTNMTMNRKKKHIIILAVPALTVLAALTLLPCPARAQDTSRNFVRSVTMLNASGTDSLEAVQYYDGLGRPTLAVATVGPQGQTACAMTTYDAVGREKRRYVPVPGSGLDYIVNTFDHSHVLSRETLQSNMGSLVFMSISGEDFLTASRHPDIIFRIYDVYNNLIQYYDENKIYKTETFN